VPSVPTWHWHYRRAGIYSNQPTSSEEKEMNLQIKGKESITAVIELCMDEADVNILVNGELVAYFAGNTIGNTYLEMVSLSNKAKGFVRTDEDGYMETRR
jgi:hypothetical protein